MQMGPVLKIVYWNCYETLTCYLWLYGQSICHSRPRRYKAGLVAMLAVDREVWLLDEPFASGMDPHGIDAFETICTPAAGRGRTIIYSTQLLDVAERFSDRVCVINKGEIHAFDTLERLREKAQDKDNVLEEMFRQLREGDK